MPGSRSESAGPRADENPQTRVKRSVEEQFTPVAADYAAFNYFAKGPDLGSMLEAGHLQGG